MLVEFLQEARSLVYHHIITAVNSPPDFEMLSWTDAVELVKICELSSIAGSKPAGLQKK